MVEPLTVVGAELLSQIYSSIQSFYQQIKYAPKHISVLLEDIDSTSHLLKHLCEDIDEDGVTFKSLGTAKRIIIIDELKELLEGLNTKVRMRRWKGKLRWGGTKVFGKEQVIREMVES
jgi:hypothetical protein